MTRMAKLTTTFLVAAIFAIGATSVFAAKVEKKGAFYKVSVVTSKDSAVITVKGLKGYHCNKLYPWKLKLLASEGVAFEKDTYKKGDAAKFEEDEVVFKVAYKTAKEAKEVKAKLKLSLCDDKQCQMESVPLSWPAR